MKLKKNNFYVLSYDGNGGLTGYGQMGEEVSNINTKLEIIVYINEDIETELDCRECIELEKQYFIESMYLSDSEFFPNDFAGISLCGFEDWKIEKQLK